MIDRLVLLGATGDLSTRHTLPALAQLVAAGACSPSLRVVGVGQEPLDDLGFQQAADRSLAEHAAHVDAAARERLTRCLSYVSADLEQRPDLRQAVGDVPVLLYLALPPTVLAPALRALAAAGVAPGSALVVEKPFGVDAASARELTRLARAVVAERDVFRIDHFLYHSLASDLLAVRSSPVLAPLWTAPHVDRVEVVWEETAAVGRRAGFYDRTGALRDMVQSHLLQLLALVAMEPPRALDADALRDAKTAVLRRVVAPGPADVATRTVRARYTAGTVRGRVQPDYASEPGVDPARATETYAVLHLEIDVPRWRGVTFSLRTGKALGRPDRRITLHLRSGRQAGPDAAAATLTFSMDPDRVCLELDGGGGAGQRAGAPVVLEAARPRPALSASARILGDVLSGEAPWAVSDAESQESWRIVDSVVDAWRTDRSPLLEYAAGSQGPPVPGT